MGGERQFEEGFGGRMRRNGRARWTYFLILVALVRGSRLLDAVAEEALAVGCDAVAHENHMSNAFGKKWDEVG